VPSTSTKASLKKAASLQPKKRPEIYLFSSSSRVIKDNDDNNDNDDIIELSSPRAQTKKRPLSSDEDAEFATA